MNKLIEFKKYLRSKIVYAYIIPKYDMYFSEELLECDERLKFVSNFSGSAGIAIILKKKNSPDNSNSGK